MGKPCRVSFFAFMTGDTDLTYGEEELDSFTRENLIDGIYYCQDLIEQGFKNEPLDEFDLAGYIAWANRHINANPDPQTPAKLQ